MDYNIIIDMVSAAIIGVVIYNERINRKDTIQGLYFFHILMICSLAIVVIDIPGLAIDGASFKGARLLLWLFDTLYWVMHVVFGLCWLAFIDNILLSSKGFKRRMIVYFVPTLAEIFVIAANLSTGWIFVIDSSNKYVKGSAYRQNLMICLIFVFLTFVIFLCAFATRKDKRKEIVLLVLSTIMPICGIVLEIFAYGYTWVWTFIIMSLMFYYINIQQKHITDEMLITANERQKAAECTMEILDSRVKVMMLQIQPHFLFNSLAVIHALCEAEPRRAADAMQHFSDFMRVNIDSLAMDRPISFEQELNHTNNYIILEKLRFEDAITVEYDISTVLFRIPSLSVQPLVENAVRYGITGREQGGIIRISTRETDTSYVVEIWDNGAGFDVTKEKNDGKTHIGISNVKNRLRNMCRGTLCISSTIGVGTEAVITIPKERPDI